MGDSSETSTESGATTKKGGKDEIGVRRGKSKPGGVPSGTDFICQPVKPSPTNNEILASFTYKDDEFYAAEADDKDAAWVVKHRTAGTKWKSDAVLSCPACFTALCFDSQKHETYKNQFRAMFVTPACKVVHTELLKYKGEDGEMEKYHPV